MSEYQIIAFRAIDKPVSEKNLEYMEKQSTRADITPWSFDNEYHYGDFRGNTKEMLRRGYDIHLHWANFGMCTVMIRFAQGIPNLKSLDPYFKDDTLEYDEDKSGPGGILTIAPCYEPDDEGDYDVSKMIDKLADLRDEILAGDPRPLYLGHLACLMDMNHDPSEHEEPPIPAGLNELTKAQQFLCRFIALPEDVLDAVREDSPKLEKGGASKGSDDLEAWLKSQTPANKEKWLLDILNDAESEVRSDVLAQYRSEKDIPSWPMVDLKRNMETVIEQADKIEERKKAKKKEAAEKKQKAKNEQLYADADKILAEGERLFHTKIKADTQTTMKTLTELHNGLEGTDKSHLVVDLVAKLFEQYPTRSGAWTHFKSKGILKPKKKGK